MMKSTNNKIMLLVIAVLLIANVVLLSLYLTNCNKPKAGGRGADRRAMMMDFLKKDIGFSEQQLVQFDTLNQQHRAAMGKMYDSIRAGRESQLKQLTNANFNDSLITGLAAVAAQKQQEVEVKMLHHFKDIRALCTDQQRPAFDSLFYKVISKKNKEK